MNYNLTVEVPNVYRLYSPEEINSQLAEIQSTIYGEFNVDLPINFVDFRVYDRFLCSSHDPQWSPLREAPRQMIGSPWVRRDVRPGRSKRARQAARREDRENQVGPEGESRDNPVWAFVGLSSILDGPESPQRANVRNQKGISEALDGISRSHTVEFLCVQGVDLDQIQRFLSVHPECTHLHIRGGDTNVPMLKLSGLTHLSIKGHHVRLSLEDSRESLIYLDVDHMCQIETDLPALQYCSSYHSCDQEVLPTPRKHGYVANGNLIEQLKSHTIPSLGLTKLHTLQISSPVEFSQISRILKLRSLRSLKISSVIPREATEGVTEFSLGRLLEFDVGLKGWTSITLKETQDLHSLILRGLTEYPDKLLSEILEIPELSSLGISAIDSLDGLLSRLPSRLQVLIYDIGVHPLTRNPDLLRHPRVTCVLSEFDEDPRELMHLIGMEINVLEGCPREYNHGKVMRSLRDKIIEYYLKEANRVTGWEL